jgi:hypothetical protein
MNKNQLDFQSQKLVVDYMAFTVPISNFCEESFANYFAKLKFNSRRVIKRGKKVIHNKPILSNKKNNYEVKFVENIEYPQFKTLVFHGPNGSRLYFYIKSGLIDWEFLKDRQLTRFDLCSAQKSKISEKSLLKFFHECQQFNRLGGEDRVERTKEGPLYKVGRRRSTQHYRIYYKDQHLRFEYEIKRDLAKDYTYYLINNDFEFFESDLIEKYIKYSSKIISLKSKYSSWLADKLRYFRKMPSSSFILKTDYIKRQQIRTVQDERNILQFIRFLAYIRDIGYEREYLGDTAYRCVIFKVSDFLKFQDETYSYYKFKKLKEFFDNLQTNFIIQKFSDSYFQSLVSVPKVEFLKEKRSVITKIWIVDDLFYYQYPFSFPDFKTTNLGKHEFTVLSYIVTTFTSTISISKNYDVNQFIRSCSTLSNKDTRLIKEYFIKYIKKFVDYNLIENNILLLNNKRFCTVEELTTQNILEGFTVYELLEFKNI